MRLLCEKDKGYIVVLVDLDRRVPIGFALLATKDRCLKWGESVLNQIIEVSIDLSGNIKVWCID